MPIQEVSLTVPSEAEDKLHEHGHIAKAPPLAPVKSPAASTYILCVLCAAANLCNL